MIKYFVLAGAGAVLLMASGCKTTEFAADYYQAHKAECERLYQASQNHDTYEDHKRAERASARLDDECD